MERFSKKKNVLFLLVLIGIFGIGFSVFALELDWPNSPGNISLDDNSTLTELIAYIYEWAIAIGGIATFIALVSAGFQYLSSAGNTAKISDAKKQITSAITGLVLLLSTFLILSTINPELTILDIPNITLEGRDFEAISPDTVSLTQTCDIIRVYSVSGYSGIYVQIADGSEESLTIPAGQGSIKFLYQEDGGSYTEGGYCQAKLYSNTGCDDDPEVIISGSQLNIGGLGLPEISCVSVNK